MAEFKHDLEWTQERIGVWASGAFPAGGAEGRLEHLIDETLEFSTAPGAKEKIEECADMMILLFSFAHLERFDLLEFRRVEGYALEFEQMQETGLGKAVIGLAFRLRDAWHARHQGADYTNYALTLAAALTVQVRVLSGDLLQALDAKMEINVTGQGDAALKTYYPKHL